MFTKKDVLQFAEVFDQLLNLADEQVEYLGDLGMDDTPVALSLQWLMPQGEALLKRAQCGDLKVMADEHYIGLLASFEIATELAAELLDEVEGDVEEVLPEYPSSATHRIQ